MSRQFSGSNLWLDLPLNLFQAQSTVNEKNNRYAYPDYKSTVSKCAFAHNYAQCSGDVVELPAGSRFRCRLLCSIRASSQSPCRPAGETGFTLTETSTDPTPPDEMSARLLPSAERSGITQSNGSELHHTPITSTALTN